MSNSKKMLQAAAGAGDERPWDVSYAYYDPPASLAWNISTAFYNFQNFSVAAQEIVPTGVFFKPDGLKMYIVGSDGDDVNEYSLSTAWLVSSSSFVRAFSVQDTLPQDVFFKPDGTKMYVAGNNSNAVREYDLSTAWNISSASFLQSFSVVSQETNIKAVFFKPDGLKMYIAGSDGDDVNEYDLSTPWDISTSVFLQSFSLAPYGSSPQGLSFKTDGTKMYFAQLSGTYEGVVEYDLSTAWDISTSVFLQNFVTTADVSSPTGLFFTPDGTGFYVTDQVDDKVYQYSLGGFDVSAQETAPLGIFFKPEGDKMYIIGSTGDDVNEYDLGTYFDTSTAVFLQSFSVAAQDVTPQNLFFKPDGTKMYTLGAANNRDVSEYNLSTAWDVSTASHSQNFSVNPQEVSPKGLFFKPEGDKMYIIGTSGDDVNEYDLSTPWDISTASFNQNFSVSAQETSPQDVFFKPDGTKMYVLGSGGDDVNEYDLSTAWDISTASFLQLFSVLSQMTAPKGIFFKPDGTETFVVGSTSDKVFTYSLGVQPTY